jgi:DNA-binding Lrp family transcriptional regulator
MVKAYVFITSNQVANEHEIVNRVNDIPQVKEAYAIYGNYDAIVIIEAETANEIRDIVTQTIRKFDDVSSTMTMIAIPE